MTWQGVKEGATLLAQATFTVSEWTGTSFKMTVTNAKNTMPVSPDINARLTAFGFGLTPAGTFGIQVPGSIYQWAFTNFPAFQRVDVCLTSGGTCAGGGYAGLGQGQSSPEAYSVEINGAFTNGVTIIPIPAKFQTALGSLETDGVVIDPPPSGASDLTITKTHNPDVAIPGGTVTYTVTVSKCRDWAVERRGDRDRDAAARPDGHGALRHRLGLHRRHTTCTRSDALAPGASYPPITVTTSVAAGAASGVVTNTRRCWQAAATRTRPITRRPTRRSSQFRLRGWT